MFDKLHTHLCTLKNHQTLLLGLWLECIAESLDGSPGEIKALGPDNAIHFQEKKKKKATDVRLSFLFKEYL